MSFITPEGLQFALEHEGFVGKPYWPGGSSGVTLDYGYDLGYHSLGEFSTDWLDEGRIICPDLASQHAIIAAVGKKSAIAASMIPKVKDCIVLEIDARAIFEEKTLPKYETLTKIAFPGVDHLPASVRAALFSLVLNRGADMGTPDTDSWETRREMREIRDAVKAQDLRGISAALRRMRRLWVGKGLDGLLTRREDEAALVESAIA